MKPIVSETDRKYSLPVSVNSKLVTAIDAARGQKNRSEFICESVMMRLERM